MRAQLVARREQGVELNALVWRHQRPVLVASTAPCGGGLGPRRWIMNAQVPHDYNRVDIDQHVGELATVLGLAHAGVGMMTAARVDRVVRWCDQGVDAEVTVGLSRPTWAASDESDGVGDALVGTVNIVAHVPVHLTDSGLLNAITTATEAKCQALWEAAIPATGTASDAVSIVCSLDGELERFGGPRSLWGARLARAVHRAVLAGARQGGA